MTIIIKRLGHHGDGIADGPVFAPLTLPGEEIGGDVVDGRIAVPKIITPSVERVTAPCRHYKSCGGCSLMHASDVFVANWKNSVVQTALKAQNIQVPFREIHTSPPHSRRRATFTARRTKKGALVGFHTRASNAIIEVSDCQLVHPDLLAVIPALKALTVMGGARKGEIRFSVTQSNSGIDVSVLDAKPLDAKMQMAFANIANEYGLARLNWDGELVAGIHPPYQTFGAALVAPPPGAFLQATKDGEQALLSAISEIIGDAKNVADLFAGCGTFALPISRNAGVLAVESDAEMLKALDAGWRQSKGLKRVICEVRDLYRRPLLPDELKQFEAVVIDPPRAGGEQQTIEIANAKVPIVAAVSCNPVTFARDANILIAAGYTMNWIKVIDQFRWSTHLELVASFTIK